MLHKLKYDHCVLLPAESNNAIAVVVFLVIEGFMLPVPSC